MELSSAAQSQELAMLRHQAEFLAASDVVVKRDWKLVAGDIWYGRHDGIHRQLIAVTSGVVEYRRSGYTFWCSEHVWHSLFEFSFGALAVTEVEARFGPDMSSDRKEAILQFAEQMKAAGWTDGQHRLTTSVRSGATKAEVAVSVAFSDCTFSDCTASTSAAPSAPKRDVTCPFCQKKLPSSATDAEFLLPCGCGFGMLIPDEEELVLDPVQGRDHVWAATGRGTTVYHPRRDDAVVLWRGVVKTKLREQMRKEAMPPPTRGARSTAYGEKVGQIWQCGRGTGQRWKIDDVPGQHGGVHKLEDG